MEVNFETFDKTLIFVFSVVFLADFCNFMVHVWNHALDGGLLSLINITGNHYAPKIRN